MTVSLGISKSMALSCTVSTRSCMFRMETNGETDHLVCGHFIQIHSRMSIFVSLNTCISDKKFVLFTWIQCLIMKASIFNNHKSWSLLIILMNCIFNDFATCNLIFYFSNYVFTLLFTTLRAEISLLLAFTKSFAWLVCRVVGLFTPREKPLQQAAWDFRWACARLIIRCYRDNDVNFIT